MKFKWIISLGIILVLLILMVYLIFKTNTAENIDGLPKYALKNEKIKEAYLFAKENPSALEGVNCYCGCMQHLHQGRIHSKGLHDCFLTADGFEIHGSECDMCVNDALQVKSLLNEGKTKEEIKKIIAEKYIK